MLIQSSLLENTVYYPSDPNQGGGPTHNDGVQVIQGNNIRLLGNTIRGQQNFPVLGAANKSNTNGLTVRNNWLDGGICSAKFEEKNGFHIDVAVTENKFGPNRSATKCVINATTGSTVAASANVMELTGLPVSVLWTAS